MLPRSASAPRSRKNTTAPMTGPSMEPMPPMTVMKMIKADQSFTLKAVSGEMRIFCKNSSAPVRPVTAATMM